MMPKKKDLKRLVRTRMEKTGESYTSALARILAKSPTSTKPLSEAELAELAGISTAAVLRATGAEWKTWLERLEAADLRRAEHRQITLHLEAESELSSWWVQSVAIGFERMVGLREIGQRREGSYDANKSKTLPVPVETLFSAFSDAAQRDRWLPDAAWEVRKESAPRSLRLTWSDGLPVELYFTAKGAAKSAVQIQHRKLASREEAVLAKEAWGERLAALAVYLRSDP